MFRVARSSRVLPARAASSGTSTATCRLFWAERLLLSVPQALSFQRPGWVKAGRVAGAPTSLALSTSTFAVAVQEPLIDLKPAGGNGASNRVPGATTDG